MRNLWLTATPPTSNGPAPSAGVDFWNLLNNSSDWDQIAPSVTTLKLYQGTVYQLPDADLKRLFSWLSANKIDLALEAGVMPVPVWPGPGAGVEGFNPSILPLLQKIKSLGGNLKYFTLDEPFFHATLWNGVNAPHYTVQQTADLIAPVLKAAWKIFPDLKIIDVEPIPYTKMIGEWLDAYKLATGRPLDGFQADIVWTADWQPSITSMLETLQDRGVAASFIINGNASDATDMSWTDSAIFNFITLMSVPGSDGSPMVFQTWQPSNPAYLLPENNPGTLTNTALSTINYELAMGAFREAGVSNPSLYELFSALRQLACGDISTEGLKYSLLNFGTVTPFTKIYVGPRAPAVPFNAQSSGVLTLNTSDCTVIAGSARLNLSATVQSAAADVIGHGTDITFLNISGGGNLYLGRYTSNITVSFSSAISLKFYPTNTNVVVRSESSAGNYFWLASTGQSIITTVGYSCVYASGWMLNGSSAITGSGTTQLNIYDGGIIRLGSNISGVGAVSLIRNASQSAFDLNIDGQKNMTVTDQSGGNVITLNDRSNTYINKGTSTSVVHATAAGAGANLIGTNGKIVLDVTTGGYIQVAASTTNVLFNLLSNTEIQLNGHASVSVNASGSNNVIRVGGAGQSVAVLGNSSTVYVDIGLMSANSGIEVKGNGTTDLIVTGAGNFTIPGFLSGIRSITVGTLALMGRSASSLAAVASNWRPPTKFDNSVTLVGSSQKLSVAGSGTAAIYASQSTVLTNITGNGTLSTVLFLSAKGSHQLGAGTANLSVVLQQSANLRLSVNPNINVLAEGVGGNYVWLASTGQSVTALSGYSCVYASGWMLDGSNTISGSGTMQLNLYDGGNVRLGSSVSGVSMVMLYRNASQSAFDLNIDGQKNMTVTDQSGGNVITLNDRSNTYINKGISTSVVHATAAGAGANLIGTNGKIVLDVTTSGDVQLGASTNNVFVQLHTESSLSTNRMEFIDVDARLGNSRIDIFGNRQTVTTGKGNSIDLHSSVGAIISGDISDLSLNRVYNFDANDTFVVKGISGDVLQFRADRANNGYHIEISQGSHTVSFDFIDVSPLGSLMGERVSSMEYRISLQAV